MKTWKAYFRDALSRDAIREQFKAGSALVRIFSFSLVASITLGVIYQFFGQYLVGTRAGTEDIAVTVTSPTRQVEVGQPVTLDVLFSAPGGKKISHLDLVVNTTGAGTIAYNANGFDSKALNGAGKYFDTTILETSNSLTGQNPRVRVVLSSRKQVSELSDKVVVTLKYTASKAGPVTFTLSKQEMEIVGPAGADGVPVSYLISSSSDIDETITVNAGATPPTPTITIAPAPSCRGNRRVNGTVARCDFDWSRISIITREPDIA